MLTGKSDLGTFPNLVGDKKKKKRFDLRGKRLSFILDQYVVGNGLLKKAQPYVLSQL